MKIPKAEVTYIDYVKNLITYFFTFIFLSASAKEVGLPAAKEHYKAIVYQLIAEQLPEKYYSTDQFSIENMALALEFINVSSTEEAKALDLQLVAPGAVFHTWHALSGTTLFDGHNNPSNARGLDYVTKLRRESEKLSVWGIPLLLIYSERNMTPGQVEVMQHLFDGDDNLMTLSLETDLSEYILPSEKPLDVSDSSLFMTDAIRVAVIKHFPEVHRAANIKAQKQGKPVLSDNLFKTRHDPMMYMDIDHEWRIKPPLILARHGILSFPVLKQLYSCLYLEEEDFQPLDEAQTKLIHQHQAYFSEFPYYNSRCTISEKWRKTGVEELYSYIHSGRAVNTFLKIRQVLDAHDINILPPSDSLPPHQPLWGGDNSVLLSSRKSLGEFYRRVLTHRMIADFHHEPYQYPDGYQHPCTDPFFVQAHNLIGIQLLLPMMAGHDKTWHDYIISRP